MPEISVIVPTYNVESTLRRCVESILAQSFRDYEIILIDDGSEDSSGAICDEYAHKYDFIRVIHKSNEGLGPTRNRGVEEARGKYVYHCDSDDWLSPDLLKDAYNAIERYSADFVVFGYTIFTETDDGVTHSYDTIKLPEVTLVTKDEIRKFFGVQYYNSFSVQSACNRLIRKDFLVKNNLEFPPLRRCQDMAFSLLLFDAANKIVCLKKPYYNYIIEPGVFKGRSYDEMLTNYLDIFDRTKKAFEKWGIYDEPEKRRLENKICEHIANYTAYAIVKKYPGQWRKCLKTLINNRITKSLFKGYSNRSRFMRLFSLGVRTNSLIALLMLSKMALKGK